MLFLIFYILIFYSYHKICTLELQSRYFFAHFLHNILVAFFTVPTIKEVLINPIQNNQDLYILVPSYLTSILGALHIYHLTFYKIGFDEIFHHIFAIYFHFFKLNKMLLASLFFMTGLPGGITYLLLILVRYNFITKLTEKRISKHLNLWCRMPGILFFASILLLNMINNPFEIQNYLTIFYMFWNSIHFTKTITESYAIAKITKKD